MAYQDTLLLINGKWRASGSGRTIPVLNPATEETIGKVAHADRSDLDEALAAAAAGFKVWRAMSALDRSKIMRKAAELMRERADAIATLMTMEQGKPLSQAKDEIARAATQSEGMTKIPIESEVLEDNAQRRIELQMCGHDEGAVVDPGEAFGLMPAAVIDE